LLNVQPTRFDITSSCETNQAKKEMSHVADQRRFFAEEVQAIGNLQTAALVEALATVPREHFLPPGPWIVRSEADVGGPPRRTPDDDARHVYHNLSIAIDPARQLFNGNPTVLASWIDALGLRPGMHVLHIGCGLGYYTAIIAHCVGPAGRVVAIEVDGALASEARAKLASVPWVDVRQGDGTGITGESFDGILVNAGMTHPHEEWLSALKPGASLILPLTCTMPQMGTIGKGIVARISRPDTAGDPEAFDARVVLGMVAIYSAVGIRSAQMNEQLGQALIRGRFPRLTRLRRDAHEASSSCWLHGDGFCLSSS
jgi:protein-L-isoaspartate(D-aspartate) O-methyltransferase